MTEALEDIQRDCVAVGLEKELDHPEIVKKVVAKLPDLIKNKWYDYCLLHNLLKGQNTEGLFKKLLTFMAGMKEIADFVAGDPSTSSNSSKSKYCSVTAITSEPASSASFRIDANKEENGVKNNDNSKKEK